MNPGGADVDDVDLEFLRTSAREALAGTDGASSLVDLAKLDWTGLLVDDDLGGAGYRPVEASVVAEELGRVRDRSGWLDTTIGAAALARADASVRDELLAGVLGGRTVTALATTSPVVRWSGVHEPDVVVLLGTDGVELLRGFGDAPRWPEPDLLDADRTNECVDISELHAERIGDAEQSTDLQALGRVLAGADAVGAVANALARLVPYLTDRIAFGVPLASCQALQHRMVDLLVFETKARAIVTRAATALAHDDGDAIALSAAAHGFVFGGLIAGTHGGAAAAIDECMQLSGGIGFTWEYPLHRELRRVATTAALFGTARTSRSLYAKVSGW